MFTILILEDDGHQRLLLEEELQREGYATVARAGGRDGLDALVRAGPDLVVLDVRAPWAGGAQLLHRVLVTNSFVPIVIYTAYAEFWDSFLSCGADACVLKRSDLSELKATIRRVLGGHACPDPLPPPEFACAV